MPDTMGLFTRGTPSSLIAEKKIDKTLVDVITVKIHLSNLWTLLWYTYYALILDVSA